MRRASGNDLPIALRVLLHVLCSLSMKVMLKGYALTRTCVVQSSNNMPLYEHAAECMWYQTCDIV